MAEYNHNLSRFFQLNVIQPHLTEKRTVCERKTSIILYFTKLAFGSLCGPKNIFWTFGERLSGAQLYPWNRFGGKRFGTGLSHL